MDTNLAPRRYISDVFRILCSNVRGLAGNFSDLTVASFQYDIQECSETLVSDMRHVSEFGRPDSVALSRCAGARCTGPERRLHAYKMVTEHFGNPNLTVVVAKWWFLWFVVRDRTFMCSE